MEKTELKKSTKTVRLTPEVHKNLKQLNLEEDHSKLNETIEYLLKEAEAWNTYG